MGISFAIESQKHGMQDKFHGLAKHGPMSGMMGPKGMMALSAGMAGFSIGGDQTMMIQELFMKLLEFFVGPKKQANANLPPEATKGLQDSMAQFQASKTPDEKAVAMKGMQFQFESNGKIKDEIEKSLDDPKTSKKLQAHMEAEADKLVNTAYTDSLGTKPLTDDQLSKARDEFAMAPSFATSKSKFM